MRSCTSVCPRIATILLVLIFVAFGAGAGGKPNESRSALVLKIGGAIGPATSLYISRGLRLAEESGRPLVVLLMDTPGGLDTSMRDINRAIIASAVPVLTYVHPSGGRAASAGTYILYASHLAAMTPGTNLGAATPVAIGGGLPLPGGGKDDDKKGTQPDPARAKAINDAVAYIRSLAELRGRNAEWAEKAVRDAASLPANEALKENVIDILADTLDDAVLQAHQRVVRVGTEDVRLNTNGIAVERFEPDWRMRLLAAITDPNIAFILIMIGLYGLIFEFMNPGALIPGTIGGIFLLTGLYALALLPVNYAGLALILLGIGLGIAEAFAPSFGILGIGGVASLVLGAAILADTEVPGFQISWTVIGAVSVMSFVLTIMIARLAIISHRRQVATGLEEMMGARGEVADWEGGKGHVITHGERWQAISRTSLSKGQRVRVAGMAGLVLRVEPDSNTET